MDLTTWLDVAIGLTLVYLGVSLFVTVINEYIAQMFNLRGRQLHAALKKLIDDKTIKHTLVQHPAFTSLFNNHPGEAGSYIDPKILGQLIVGSLSTTAAANNAVGPNNAASPVAQIIVVINQLPHSVLKTQLQSIARTAGDKTEDLVTAVSDWMDRSLTMMGGNYKRKLQTISFGVGLVITVMLNINTITLTERLYHDKELRNATAAMAIQVTERINKETFEKCRSSSTALQDPACIEVKKLTDITQNLGKLPIGWPDTSLSSTQTLHSDLHKILFWGERLLGWFLTALAVSLGAPFWFDLLNKAVSIRHGMRKPVTGAAEKTEKA